MMNFPAVIAGDPRELAKLGPGGGRRTPTATRRGCVGRDLDAYLATGIATDHEATTYEEALAKRRRGCGCCCARPPTPATCATCCRWCASTGRTRCAFCTDDREPDMLLREGHINQMCRVAVAEGIAGRGRPGARHPQPRPLPRAARGGGRRARATGPTCCCSRPARVPAEPRGQVRPGGGGRGPPGRGAAPRDPGLGGGQRAGRAGHGGLVRPPGRRRPARCG